MEEVFAPVRVFVVDEVHHEAEDRIIEGELFARLVRRAIEHNNLKITMEEFAMLLEPVFLGLRKTIDHLLDWVEI